MLLLPASNGNRTTTRRTVDACPPAQGRPRRDRYWRYLGPAKLMDDAETEVLSYMDFPRARCLQIHSTNPLERLNAEIQRRANLQR